MRGKYEVGQRVQHVRRKATRDDRGTIREVVQVESGPIFQYRVEWDRQPGRTFLHERAELRRVLGE